MKPISRGTAVVVAVTAFIAIQFFLHPLIPKPTCSDGWRSPSIGLRGACSWHGGVHYSGLGGLFFIVGIGLGFGVYSLLVQPLVSLEKREQEERQAVRLALEAKAAKQRDIEKSLAQKYGVACSYCGAPLKLRGIRRGRNQGKMFIGCSGYPKCNNTKYPSEVKVREFAMRLKEFWAAVERRPSDFEPN